MAAGLIVREAADLSPEDRRILDAELCADVTKLDGVGDTRISAAAERAAKAEADRRVAIRPAPDAMSYVTALLPAAQGSACVPR